MALQIKESLKRKTESLLIAAQINAIRTNYTKARIDKLNKIAMEIMWRHTKRLITFISECSKQAQKEYKTGWARRSSGNCARNLNLTM